MHLYGIREDEAEFTTRCDFCGEEAGFSRGQVEDMLERKRFTFVCPRGKTMELYPVVLQAWLDSEDRKHWPV